MDDKTKQALEDSIKKWEGMLANIRVGKAFPYPGASNCPLCREFNGRYEEGMPCYGCPVRAKTGLHGCSGTPYWDFIGPICGEDEAGWVTEDHVDMAEMVPLAEAELEFLKSLREENAK